MADVPVGAFLSGGLDSSAIVALIRPHVEELHTFSVGLPGSPDLEAARLVAEHVGTIHHEYVLDAEEIRESLPAIVHALESFDQDLVRSAVPTFFTARLASEHLKVILTGEGADELFAGYGYHKSINTPAQLDADARRSIGELHQVNLQRVDRLTMAHSIEARVPFLKAQFDQGTGAADLLPAMAEEIAAHIDPEEYRSRYPGTALRSAEECRYHEILVGSLADPGPTLDNVARWTDR